MRHFMSHFRVDTLSSILYYADATAERTAWSNSCYTKAISLAAVAHQGTIAKRGTKLDTLVQIHLKQLAIHLTWSWLSPMSYVEFTENMSKVWPRRTVCSLLYARLFDDPNWYVSVLLHTSKVILMEVLEGSWVNDARRFFIYGSASS